MSIRPYSTKDREKVREIAAATAFFGAPVGNMLEDPALFCDAFYSLYTDILPGDSWVAEDEGRVVGFLMGCRDTNEARRLWRRRVAPVLVVRLLQGRYRIGRRALRYLLGHALAYARYRSPAIDLEQFPAHLHVNVRTRFRGRGWGHRLLLRFLDHLAQIGAPGVHLTTTDRNQAACYLYEKLGFELLESRPSHAWTHLLNRPVERRAYGLRLF